MSPAPSLREPAGADWPPGSPGFCGEDQDLIDLSRDAVLRVEPGGRIVAWGPRAQALYGWSATEAIGADLESLLSVPTSPPPPLAYAVLAADGRWSGRLARRTADGSALPVRVEWFLTVCAEGFVDGFIELGRPEASADDGDALRASEARYRQLFRRAPVALMLDDPGSLADLVAEMKAADPDDIDSFLDANPAFLNRAIDTLALIEVNDQALDLFGATAAGQLLGPVRHIWADAPRTFRNALAACYRGQAAFSEETRIRTLDGRTVEVLFSLSFAADDEGHSLNGLRDISARRAAQARLRKVTADYAHAARLSILGELTTSTAHEVKQPLSAILAFAQTGLRWLDRDVPEIGKVSALAGRIAEQAQRASAIIERIRSLAGKRDSRREAVDLNDAVRECLVFVRHESDEKRVALTVDLDRAAPEIQGDRIQVQQVVVNLILNAIQALQSAAPARREIRLATRACGQDQVVLTVDDNGPGFAAADLESVFESFVTNRPGALGIGLSICRSIVAAHGGAISASRSPEGGARLRVSLPMRADREDGGRAS